MTDWDFSDCSRCGATGSITAVLPGPKVSSRPWASAVFAFAVGVVDFPLRPLGLRPSQPRHKRPVSRVVSIHLPHRPACRQGGDRHHSRRGNRRLDCAARFRARRARITRRFRLVSARRQHARFRRPAGQPGGSAYRKELPRRTGRDPRWAGRSAGRYRSGCQCRGRAVPSSRRGLGGVSRAPV